MSERDHFIEQAFPAIGDNYQIASTKDVNYNCIAFAADDNTKWWWPGRYWPPGIPERIDLDSFIVCYKSLGYKECGLNGKFENGYEKIAIFVDSNGLPTHAAKQDSFSKGLWKSKLGEYKDIEHTIKGISGNFNQYSYGNVAIILKRKISSF